MTIPAPEHDAAHISFCLLDAHGRVQAAKDPHRPYYAASTIKLHVLIAALRAVDDGHLDLAQMVPSTRRTLGHRGEPVVLEGDHLDPTQPREGTPVPLREWLVRMIDRSSNEATNIVIGLVGLEAVADAITELGLVATRVERRIGDVPAREAGLTNETCAEDLARTIRALATGGLVSAEATELAREAMRAQRIPVIARALRPGVEVGSKSGEVEGIRHDVAFLGDPTAPSARFAAVLTSGFDAGQGDEAVQAIAAALLPDLGPQD